MKELAFQQAYVLGVHVTVNHIDVSLSPSTRFDSALRASVSQDLTALKRRQQQVAHQCSTLAERLVTNRGWYTPLCAVGDCLFSSIGPSKSSYYNRTISSNGERGTPSVCIS